MYDYTRKKLYSLLILANEKKLIKEEELVFGHVTATGTLGLLILDGASDLGVIVQCLQNRNPWYRYLNNLIIGK